jgi:hypothetical protein
VCLCVFVHSNQEKKVLKKQTTLTLFCVQHSHTIYNIHSWKYDVNITRIESRPVTSDGGGGTPKFDFFIDFHGKVDDPNVNALLHSLQQYTTKLLVLDEKEVHWFPRHISELDLIANRTLDAGTDLEANHPGFHDEAYRRRRATLANVALQHRTINECIPKMEYTKEEVETWGLVWDTMEGLWEKYACKEYKVSSSSSSGQCAPKGRRTTTTSVCAKHSSKLIHTSYFSQHNKHLSLSCYLSIDISQSTQKALQL